MFRGGHVLMYPKGGSIASTKVIVVCHGKLYRFLFQPVGALVSSVNDGMHGITSRDLCELWHKRMAHLHHGTLLILR